MDKSYQMKSMRNGSMALKHNITPRTSRTPENVTKGYIEAIAWQLRASEKVTCHPMLRAEYWTEACYEFLAKIIKEELNKKLPREQRMKLGTSLSFKTLQKIILKEYKITYPIDPRKRNTLTKVVIFLGYASWENFTNEIDQTQQKEDNKIPQNKPIRTRVKAVHSGTEHNPQQEIIELVKKGIRNEYEAYHDLPEIYQGKLLQTHIKNSPAYNLILDMLIGKKEKLVISNPHNPSAYAILDTEIKKLEADYALVYTQEYWFLCWWDVSRSRYVHRYKNISDHFYILHKIDGCWKIGTNASAADPVKGI